MDTRAAIQEKLREARQTGRAKVLHFEEEAQKLLQRMVEKGRDAQAEGLRRLESLKAHRPLGATTPIVERAREGDLWRRVAALRAEVESRFDGGMDRLLEGLGLASREDVEKLHKRMEALNARVGELSRAQKRAAKESRNQRSAAEGRGAKTSPRGH